MDLHQVAAVQGDSENHDEREDDAEAIKHLVRERLVLQRVRDPRVIELKDAFVGLREERDQGQDDDEDNWNGPVHEERPREHRTFAFWRQL